MDVVEAGGEGTAIDEGFTVDEDAAVDEGAAGDEDTGVAVVVDEDVESVSSFGAFGSSSCPRMALMRRSGLSRTRRRRRWARISAAEDILLSSLSLVCFVDVAEKNVRNELETSKSKNNIN